MKLTLALSTVLAILLGASTASAMTTEREGELTPLRLAAARAVYQSLLAGTANVAEQTRVEGHYQWSLRIMRAELELAPSDQALKAAVQAHEGRMDALRTLSERQLEAGQLSGAIFKMVLFYALEAEAWVAGGIREAQALETGAR